MHQLLISILSTLIIPSSGLPSLPSGSRLSHTQAWLPIPPPPNLSPFNLSVPSIPPTSNHSSNLTVWPPLPIFLYLPPSTFMRINSLSIPTDMPRAGAMLNALTRMIRYLDGYFSSPHDLLPPNFVSEEPLSMTAGIASIFSSGQGNRYTWALARSVLTEVAVMEYIYGSVQLDEVIVIILGEQNERTFRLEKFDIHPDAGNIILPRTLPLPSNSRPSLSLLPNRTLTYADPRGWPATPFTVEIVPGSITLTIIMLTPVQDYLTIKADIEALYDELGATGHLQDLLPSYVSLQKGRVTVRFYSTNLERSVALQVLLDVGVLEAFHGAAEIGWAALEIDGKQGSFSLRISRAGVRGLDEDAEPTISRRSLSSNNK